MKCKTTVFVVTILAVLPVDVCDAFASPPATLLTWLARHMTQEAANETAEKLTKELGEATVQKFTTTVIKQGGDESLELASVLIANYGSDIVRAINNSPSVTPILKALDDLPANQIPKAAARLAAGSQGSELAETVIRYGSPALRAEVSHPGVGGHIVRALGTDGASLCGRLSSEQAISLGRYVDDIAQVPPTQRKQFLEVINQDKDRFFKWLGGFVEANPGKTIGAVTFVTIFLPNSERILGGEDVVEFGPNGDVKITTKPGVAGRTTSGFTNLAARAGDSLNEAMVKPLGNGFSILIKGVAMVVLIGLCIFSAIKLWGAFKREKISVNNLEHRETHPK